MLNTERKDGYILVTDNTGQEVGRITYQDMQPKKCWLVQFSKEFEHGTGTMWWQSLKAAEYHVLAVYIEHTDK